MTGGGSRSVAISVLTKSEEEVDEFEADGFTNEGAVVGGGALQVDGSLRQFPPFRAIRDGGIEERGAMSIPGTLVSEGEMGKQLDSTRRS